MKRYGLMISFILMVFGLWIVPGTSAVADTPGSQLTVSVAPGRLSTSVGTPVDVKITVVNTDTKPTPEMAIHIGITEPRMDGSVDPEDWTPTLTKSIGEIGSGKQVTESWTLTPIGRGDFVLYAVAIDANAGVDPATLAVSNGVPVHVDEKRSVNPQGVLPLAIAMPTLIGMALLWRHRRLRPK